MPNMKAEEFYNSLREEGPNTRIISRTIQRGILKIKYETRNSEGTRVGLVVGTAAGLELGPGVVVTGLLGATIGGLFDTWTICTRYFDNSTGTFLGTSRNEAAVKCNENGLQEFRLCSFDKAADWFNKAYHTCSNEYGKEDQFENNRNVANIAANAKCLLNEGQYVSAKSEFQRAYNLSDNAGMDRIIKNCIVEVKQKQNEAALNSNQRGEELLQGWNFKDAEGYFHQAFLSCTNDFHAKITFSNNRLVAENASKAQALLYRNEYTSAVSKLQEAYHCVGFRMQDTITNFINHIKFKQNETASNLYQQGLLLFREKHFERASQNFEAAYNSCTLDCAFRSKYINNMEVAAIMSEGRTRLERNDYSVAIDKFQEAHRIVGELNASVIIDYIHLAQGKQNELATNFYQQGLLLFREKHFERASQNFEAAYNSCTLDYAFRSKYINNMKVAAIMSEGTTRLERNDYSVAINKFQEARRIVGELNASVIIDCIHLAQGKQNELATNFYQQGLTSFRESRFAEASQNFAVAYYSCTDNFPAKSKYQNAREIVNITSEAQVMFNIEEFDAAITMFEEAYRLSCDSEMKHNISIFIDKTSTSKAEFTWKQGKLEWDNAWVAENGNNVEEANTKFQKANCYFSKALNIKDDAKYQSWQKASCLKIEGIKLFNQGIKLFEDSQLQEALKELRKAQKLFQQGFLTVRDAKFSECVNYVQCRIQFIEDKYQEMEEAEEINAAMRALIVDIPVTLSHAELDNELQLEDQVHTRRLSDLCLSRQAV